MKVYKKSKKGNVWLRGLIVAVLCALGSFLIFKLGLLNYLENKSYDRRMKDTADFFIPSEELVFIAVDQESLDWAQKEKNWSWPWPREAYANIVDFLSAGNVNAIMFDMLYTEPSIYGKEDDLKFAKSQWDSGKVCQTIFVQDFQGERILLPIEPLKESAAIIANVTSTMDSDDVIRRYKPFREIKGVEYPSLGIAPLVLEGEKIDFPTMNEDGTVKLRYQKSMEKYHPYRASDILESYDAWKNGEEGIFVPEDFEGTYSFFALYAPGLFDICSTPVSQVFPGVGVHITALDNYLQNNFIKEVPEFFVVLWFLVISILASIVVVIGEKQKTQGKIMTFLYGGFVLGIIIAFAFPVLLFILNYNIPQVCPFLSYLASFAINFGFVYMLEGKQKRFIKSAFSQCLSKDVVNEIVNNPDSFTLGGKKMKMSAIFTDIEKFSSFSELLTASQLGTLLNYYLTKMSDIIINEHGTVDKYEGDAIVAMVGAPVQMDDHAIRACRAALKMKKEESLMNEEIKAVVAGGNTGANIDPELFEAFKILVQNNKKIYTRIGINSGEMIAGYFGSTMKKNYTIMGNNVNLASRLEGVNKQYCTGGILISEMTRSLLGDDFIVRPLDRVQVVNVTTPIQLYELLEEKSLASPDLIEYVKNWELAMDSFIAENYETALEQFKTLRAENHNDNVAVYYINLLEKYFIKGAYPTERDDAGVAYNPDLKVFKLLQK